MTVGADRKVKLVLSRGYQVVEVDVTRDKALADKFGVTAVPTVVMAQPDGRTGIGAIEFRELTDPATFLAALRRLRAIGQ